MEHLIPLSTLPRGYRAQVAEVLGGPEQVHRLRELGVCGGVDVEVVESGSPCILRLDGAKLCFRGNELVNVLVRPAAG